jgi:transcription termination factor Rho
MKEKEYSLVELEERELKELQKIAGQAGVEDEEIEDASKHNLIFKVLEAQAKKSGLLFSEGVLETLEDGMTSTFRLPRSGNSNSGPGTRSAGSSGPPRTERNTSP